MQQGFANRGTPQAQALRSGLLLIPGIVLVVLQSLPYAIDSLYSSLGDDLTALVSLFFGVLGDLYFVGVVAVLARTDNRRALAAAAAIAATAADVGWWAFTAYVSYLGRYVDMAAAALATILFVTAWGLARRQSPKWALGLLPTVVVAAVGAWLPRSDFADNWPWFAYPLVWLAAFLACCLICWAIDASGAKRPAGTVGPPGYYPPPGYPPPQQWP